jgi:hypothetical protein
MRFAPVSRRRSAHHDRSPPIASPEKAVPVASLGVAVIVAFSRTAGAHEE